MLTKKQERLYFYMLFACYIICLFFASLSTSPIYPVYQGHDSSIFSLLGKGLTIGKELYIDLFDHKGPIIFFINALGYYWGGRNSIFLIQLVFGTVSLYFLYRTANLLLDTQDKIWWKYLFIFIAGYSQFFYTFKQGNLTEEYSLPFISCSLYLFVKYSLNLTNTKKHPPLYALIYGVCISVIAFLRLNNAVTIGVGILCIMLWLIYEKQYSNLFLNLLFGFLGVCIVAVPILLYFHIHDSVYEMIYATFLHNFTIYQNTGHKPIIENIYKYFTYYFPLIVSIILIALHIIKQRTVTFTTILLSAIVVGNLFVLFIANRFEHYFVIFNPVYIVIMAAYLQFNLQFNFKSIRVILVTLCTLINLYYIAYVTLQALYAYYYIDVIPLRNDRIAQELSYIPEDEKKSVIGFNIQPDIYHIGNIIPCYKYYTLQETWSITNPQIFIDFMEWVAESKPTWILITPNEDNTDILNILEQSYELVRQTNDLVLYRIAE